MTSCADCGQRCVGLRCKLCYEKSRFSASHRRFSCKKCGVIFQAKGTRKYCSRGCSDSSPSEKKGTHSTYEVREKLRQAHLGNKQSPESNLKRRAALQGIKRSPEFGQRISAARNRPETKLKIRAVTKQNGYHNAGWFRAGVTKESDARALKHSQDMKESYLNGSRTPRRAQPGFYAVDLGHFVRSGWEANVARLIKYLGITYEYEKHRFHLPDGTVYIPDFYIPAWDLFIEVKGNWSGKGSANKASLFTGAGLGRLLLIDAEAYKEIGTTFRSVTANWNVRG